MEIQATVKKLIALIMLSLLFSLGAVEIALRMQTISKDYLDNWAWATSSHEENPYQLDGSMIWALKKNYINSYADEDNPTAKVSTNDRGQRNNPYRSADSLESNSIIVVIVGDSFTFGHGVTDEHTMPAQLQLMANQSGKDVYFINAGSQGYHTEQEYIYLSDVLLKEYQPNLIIWNINQNDFFDMDNYPLFVVFNDHLVRLPAWTNGIYLQRLFIEKFAFLLPHSHLAKFISTLIVKFNFATLIQPPTMNRSFIKIKKMIEDIRKTDIPVIIVQTPSELYLTSLRGTEADTEASVRSIIDELGSTSTDYLNTNKAIEQILANSPEASSSILGSNTDQATPSALFIYDDPKEVTGSRHMSVQGNYYYAKVIFDFLSKTGKLN